MGNEYIKIPIKQLTLKYNTGLDAIKRAPIVNEDTGIKCLRIQDISQNKDLVNWGNAKVSDKDFLNFQLKKNYIMIARTGASIGVVKFVSADVKSVFNNGLIRLIPNESKVNPKYLYYNLISNDYKNHIYGISSGTATQPNMKMGDLLDFKINLANLNDQNEIVNILSSLDDKIEINNKINSNLEELAQTLYKRWFVDFEFPSEEGKPYRSSGGEMVESELGLIPKGWVVESLSDNQYCSLIKPGIKLFDDEKTYIATADVSNTKITNLETKITMNDRPIRANMQPQTNSIWFAKMKDSRKLMRFSETSSRIDDLILSTGFAGVLCTAALDYFWTFLQTPEFDTAKNSLANGTTMEAINNSGISLIKLVIPDNQILSAFNQILNPMYEMIKKNEIQNLNLANTRDLLLPKLMSGEIEV